MKRIINILLAINIVFLCSCANFLKENSQNLAYVETVSDLDEILVGAGYITPSGSSIAPDEIAFGNWTLLSSQVQNYYARIHIMDDDATEFACGEWYSQMTKLPREHLGATYKWQINPLDTPEDEDAKDMEWGVYYGKIAILNSVIFQLEELGEKEPDKDMVRRVEGEARFLRAQYYFWLTNLYGKPYCKATAETDLAIPLKITEYIEDKYFSRSTQKEVYEQIAYDLERSRECLKGINFKTAIRAGAYAPTALLSRVYLYMEEYEKAIEMANEVIASEYKLLDYNSLKVGESLTYRESPEIIFTQGYNLMGALHSEQAVNKIASSYTSSADLLESYTKDDLRFKHYFVERLVNTGTYRCSKWKNKIDGVVSDRWAIRLPEMYLNKAEAEACLGRTSAATTIQILRANRFAPENLTELNLTGEELVRFIRDERRRELCYEGHRWFDLRRYAVNSKYPFSKSIEHIALAYDMENKIFYEYGTYILKPYAEDIAAYVFPIPNDVITFNKGNIKNEIRSVRSAVNN